MQKSATLFLFVSLLLTGVYSQTPAAWDGFESGDLNGGTGWVDPSWSSTGDYLIFGDELPYEGAYLIRLNNYAFIERSVDLSQITNIPYLDFAYKGKRMSGTGFVEIWDGTWHRIFEWNAQSQGYQDFTWFTQHIGLSGYDWNRSDFRVRFGYDCSKRNYAYFDAIKIVGESAPAPVTVTLQDPANGVTTPTAAPLLSWSADNPAGNFHLLLADNSGFSDPEVDDTTLSTVTYQTADLTGSTTYYWKVRAKDAQGTWWDWSVPASFTTPAVITNRLLIQAEDFDNYYDSDDYNEHLMYRLDTGVDICKDHTDIDGSTLFHGITSEGKQDYRVTSMSPDEWLEWNIDIPATDNWKITFNGALNFDLSIDGQVYQTGIGISPDTPTGPIKYTSFNFELTHVPLTQGPHTIRLVNHHYWGYLDHILFESETNPPPPLANNTKPYDDSSPPPVPDGYISPVQQLGQLYVDGPNIYSSTTGKIAQMRFVALHGPIWFETVKNNTIYNLAYHENIQGIRLPMYAEWGTWDDPSMRPLIKDKVHEIIKECIDAGIYLELTYHRHMGQAIPNDDYSYGGDVYTAEMEFWNWVGSLPEMQSPPPNIIYGIINEVADSRTSWATVRPFAQDMVDKIRTFDPGNLILCGTPQWCQKPDDVIGNELTGGNIAYPFHFYLAVHPYSLVDNVLACYDAGVAIWCNEVSPGNFDWQTGGYNFPAFDAFIDEMETRGIPWTNWNWSNKGEHLSAFQWYSQYYGPWQASDFTEGGLYIRDKLNKPFPDQSSGGTFDVHSLTLTGVGPVQGTKYYAVVDGSVRDESGAGVDGAVVHFTWSGDVSGSGTATTSGNGSFSLESSKVRGGGTFTFTIDAISKQGFTVDDDLFTEPWSASVSVP